MLRMMKFFTSTSMKKKKLINFSLIFKLLQKGFVQNFTGQKEPKEIQNTPQTLKRQ